MNELTVAVVQMNSLKDNLEHNLSTHRRIAEQASESGSDLIVFPELSTTGLYGEEGVVDLAEEIGRGPVHDAMTTLAAELHCSIGYGICERDGGAFYNSFVLVAPSGVLGVQRKVHASLDEYIHFRMGGSLNIFSIGEWRVGIAVCADAAYFEVWRIFAINGADLVLLPHAGRNGHGVEISESDQTLGLEKRSSAAPGKYGVYASDNALFAAFCNQVGYNGHSMHAGGAWIAGPDGQVLASADPILEDTFALAPLDPEALHLARRNRNSTLRTRRPALYGDLVRL